MCTKKKVAFLLDHNLKEYRIPFFKGLIDEYEVTVFHVEPFVGIEGVNEIIVHRRDLLSFFYYKSISINSFDVAVIMSNLRMLNFYILTLNPFLNTKIIHWGIGVSSKNGLQKTTSFSILVRNVLGFLSDGIAFYSQYPLKYYSEKNQLKSLVVGNTIENNLHEDLSDYKKDSFIFIGSLHQRKGLDLLINAFQKYLQNKPGIDQLLIVGDGAEREKLRRMLDRLGIQDNVTFKGSVYSFKDKRKLFKRAIACISPNQAGLSVLESFSFGVPFITKTDPISGGEHLNIIHNETGIYFDGSEYDLLKVIDYIDKHQDKMKEMGAAAYIHYQKKMSMSNMISNFKKLIEN